MRQLKLWLLLSFGLAQAQVITTVAGSDPVFPTAGVPAIMAPLRSPSGLAVDSKGNIYIADAGNCIVSRVSPDGTLTVVAGNGRPGFSGDGGPAVNAELFTPLGLAVDGSGNLYIADSDNSRIRKVSGGVISTVAGNGQGYYGDFTPRVLSPP